MGGIWVFVGIRGKGRGGDLLREKGGRVIFDWAGFLSEGGGVDEFHFYFLFSLLRPLLGGFAGGEG